MAYTKLANSILTSTLWMEDDATRLVWVTMLAMKNRYGEVQGSIPGLANVARVPVDACRAAIGKLLAPDPDSRTKDYDGRRIEVIDGGWVILNHTKYSGLDSDDDKRRKDAIRQQRHRDRLRLFPEAETSHRDAVTNNPRGPHVDVDVDLDEDKNREGEREAHTPPSGEQEGKGKTLEEYLRDQGCKLTRDGQDLLPEWRKATKGLRAVTVMTIMDEAKPGIQWPSEFKAHRAQRGI